MDKEYQSILDEIKLLEVGSSVDEPDAHNEEDDLLYRFVKLVAENPTTTWEIKKLAEEFLKLNVFRPYEKKYS